MSELAAVAVRTAACSSLGERAFGVPAALLRDAYGLAADDPVSTARAKLAQALAQLGADAAETRRLSALLGHVLDLEADDSRTREFDPEQLKREIFLAVQAIVERQNICGYIAYHTAAGVHLRPYGTRADDQLPTADLRVYELIGQKATELTGPV